MVVGYFERGFVVKREKSMLLKHIELVGSRGGEKTKKRGTPRNEGISRDVDENKGQKKLCCKRLEVLLKTIKLWIFCRC